MNTLSIASIGSLVVVLAGCAGADVGVASSDEAEALSGSSSSSAILVCVDQKTGYPLHPGTLTDPIQNFTMRGAAVTLRWVDQKEEPQPFRVSFTVRTSKKGNVVTYTNAQNHWVLTTDPAKIIVPGRFSSCQEDEDGCTDIPGHGYGTMSGDWYDATLSVGGKPDVAMICDRE